MTTPIYIREEVLRKYVDHLKSMVDREEIKVGITIFSIATKPGKRQPEPQVGPPDLQDFDKTTCRVLLEKTGFLSRVGNILSGTGILNNSFNNYTTDHIVELCLAASKEGRTGTKKSVKPPAPHVEEPPEFIDVPLYELINTLDRDELVYLGAEILRVLSEFDNVLAKNLKDSTEELERRTREIADVRAELRDVKVQLMESREALGHARTHVTPRVVERYVNLPNKPIPPGMQSGGGGGKPGSSVVVHRKPLMGHAPKVVRDLEKK